MGSCVRKSNNSIDDEIELDLDLTEDRQIEGIIL